MIYQWIFAKVAMNDPHHNISFEFDFETQWSAYLQKGPNQNSLCTSIIGHYSNFMSHINRRLLSLYMIDQKAKRPDWERATIFRGQQFY